MDHRVKLREDKEVSAVLYEARETRLGACLVFAHGAGAGQTSPFIQDLATGLANRGIDVFTFNFPYMEARRRVPDRPETLQECFRAAIGKCRELVGSDERLYVGGKSLGGRMASHLAAGDDASRLDLAGLIVLGYPLHPPGKPEKLRTQHLNRLSLPTLIIQGARDPFGAPEELRRWFDRPGVTILGIDGADHSFKVPRSSKPTQDQIFADMQNRVALWVAGQ